MPQKKLIRFAELKTFRNVLEFPDNMAGNWARFFGNENAITLELACGKGEYALGLAALYAGRNFIGIDLKGNRLWVGAKKAQQEQLNNVAFLRTQIDHLDKYFLPGEVEEIWITFPDPQLRVSKAKKRLTHPRFLRIYAHLLKKNGTIHLKTDSPELYEFTKLVIRLYDCKILEDMSDLYGQTELPEELKIKTHYESLDIAQSNRIHYLRFTLPAQLPGEATDRDLKQLLKDEGTG